MRSKNGIQAESGRPAYLPVSNDSCLECSNSDLVCFKTAVFVDVISRFDGASVGSGYRLWNVSQDCGASGTKVTVVAPIAE
jgi:hypothetical protein